MRQGTFNPERLRRARLARGLNKKELAERTGISRQMISNYELGKTIPGGKNLLSIVKVLDFPHHFFTTETKRFHAGATFFRSQSAATKKSRDMQGIRLEFQKEIYDFLSQYVDFPPLTFPDSLMKSVNDISDEDIEQKAKELRHLWGIADDLPISNLIETAEVHGVIIVEANMSDNTLDAVSEFIEDRAFIMLTDNSESAVRRRFNVAHELGHLLLHGDIESIYDYTPQELKKIEAQANYFASCFLLPSQGFTDSLLSTNLEFYIEMKNYWKVSMQAMIMRTYQLEFINEDQKLYLFKRIAAKKWKKQEPLDDEIPLEVPSLYRKVLELIVENGVLTKSYLIHQFSLPKDELEKSFGMNLDEDFSVPKEPVLRIVK